MKEVRKMRKLLLLMVAVLLVLSFVSCSDTKKSSEDKATTTISDNTTTTVGQKQTDNAENSSSMSKFISSLQTQIDQMKESLKTSGMNLDVFARGNSLVYSYKYDIDVGDKSVVKDALNKTMDSLSSTFTTILSSLKTAVPDAESIIVEYLDKDGNILVSKEYK